jgi:hypothetical protein
MASVTSPPLLVISSTRNGLRLVWISLMKFMQLFHNIWQVFDCFSSVLIHIIIPIPMNKMLELKIKCPWIQNVFHFIFMFTIDFNKWMGIVDFSWNGRRMVRFQQRNMKHMMDSWHWFVSQWGMDLALDDLTFLMDLLFWYVVVKAKFGLQPWS